MCLDEGAGVCGKGAAGSRRRRPADPVDRGPHRRRHRRVSEAWVDDVLSFWFAHGKEDWWRANPEFDAEISRRFHDLWERERENVPEHFLGSADEALAAVILFDQFPRNMFRGHADQFSTDPLALAIARGATDKSYDDGMTSDRRGFLYMPFQHSEDLRDQASPCSCSALWATTSARLCPQAPCGIERSAASIATRSSAVSRPRSRRKRPGRSLVAHGPRRASKFYNVLKPLVQGRLGRRISPASCSTPR